MSTKSYSPVIWLGIFLFLLIFLYIYPSVNNDIVLLVTNPLLSNLFWLTLNDGGGLI